jgi:hypothetical protein
VRSDQAAGVHGDQDFEVGGVSLLLRYSPAEAVVRSVGGEPHGILAVSSHPDHFGFVVDGQRVPEGAGDIQAVDPDGLPEHLTPVTVSEVVDGVEEDRELRFLWVALTGCLTACTERLSDNPGYMPSLEGLVAATQEFLDAVASS